MSNRKKHWPDPPWPPPVQSVTPSNLQAGDLVHLYSWMQSMSEWGKNVRDDIIRLEAATGIGPGEPGDPPPSPWKPK